MENSWRVLALLLVALMCGTIRADDSVSAAFTFDARYPASGLTPADWEAHEAVGLSERFAAATVMRAADLNGNGIPDVWESLYGLSGMDAAADADPDGDGRTNLQEYNAGTNPVLAENYLASSRLAFKLSWQSAKGRTYGVYTCTNLASGWSDKPDVELQGTGDVIEYVPQTMNPAMFFKVTVRLADDY